MSRDGTSAVLRAQPASGVAASLVVLAACGCGAAHHAHARPPNAHATRPHAAGPRVTRRTLGRSVRGRAIDVVHVTTPGARRTVLVVGCVHGDETAGITVAKRLERRRASRLDLWVVEDLNPDGVAARTRQNANRVDLNRNFPERWRPLGRPGDQQYSGTHALSEPEARIAYSLIRRVKPAVSIWFHQPVGVVDESGGDLAIERRFSQSSGLPLRRLTRYPGSAVGWQNAALPGTTAFVVELPPGPPGSAAIRRYARAVLAVAR